MVALGPKCQVTCLDAVTGEHRWSMNLVRQYARHRAAMVRRQCPLIDGNQVVLPRGARKPYSWPWT